MRGLTGSTRIGRLASGIGLLFLWLAVLPVASAAGQEATFYLTAESSASGTQLSVDPASGTDVYSPQGIVAQNLATSTLDTALDAERVVYEFETNGPIGQDMYLNLTNPLYGEIYWSSTAARASGYESATVRVEIFQGNIRIAGVEGGAGMRAAPHPALLAIPPLALEQDGLSGAWRTIDLAPRFQHLETHKIDGTMPLKVLITHLGGTSDLQIGTGGEQPSSLSFRYFEVDPLGKGVYLEEGALRPANQGGDAANPFAAGAFGLMSFVALQSTRTRRLRVILLACLLAGLSGCSKASDDPGPGATEGEGPIQETRRDGDPTLVGTGNGSLEGVVRGSDRLGAPVAGALVQLVGEGIPSQVTDADGRFSFRPLQPGAYFFRVDAAGYTFREGSARVEAERATVLNITLKASGLSFAHGHSDAWRGEERILLYDEPAVGAAIGATPGFQWTCPSQRGGFGLPSPNCELPIPIDRLTPVPPGTAAIEVVLEWGHDETAPEELGLKAQGPTSQRIRGLFSGQYVPRAAGETFSIPIWPDLTDPGHQEFTNWAFSITLSPSYLDHLNRLPVDADDVSAKIWANRGTMAYEPPHPDRWQGKEAIVLFDGVARYRSGCSVSPCDYPSNSGNKANEKATWFVPADLWVPTGADRIEGVLTWTPAGATDPSPLKWTLVYHGADGPLLTDCRGCPSVTEENRVDGRLEFVIDLSSAEAQKMTDQPYQTRSYWSFWIDDQRPPITDPSGWAAAGSTNLGFASWTLSATVYKEAS